MASYLHFRRFMPVSFYKTLLLRRTSQAVACLVSLTITLTVSKSTAQTQCHELFSAHNYFQVIKQWQDRYHKRSLKDPDDRLSFSAEEAKIVFQKIITEMNEIETDLKRKMQGPRVHYTENWQVSIATLAQYRKILQTRIKAGFTYRELIYETVRAAGVFEDIMKNLPATLPSFEYGGNLRILVDHLTVREFIESNDDLFLVPIFQAKGHLEENFLFRNGALPAAYLQVSSKEISAHGIIMGPKRFLIHDFDHAFYYLRKFKKLTDEELERYQKNREMVMNEVLQVKDKKLQNEILTWINVVEREAYGLLNAEDVARASKHEVFTEIFAEVINDPDADPSLATKWLMNLFHRLATKP